MGDILKSRFTAGSKLAMIALRENGPSTLRQLGVALGYFDRDYGNFRTAIFRQLHPLIDRKIVHREQCRQGDVYTLLHDAVL